MRRATTHPASRSCTAIPYHVPIGRSRAGIPPANRPGIPPVIITWADPAYLADFCKDIAALVAQPSTPAPMLWWVTGRTIRCRSSSIRGGQSITVLAIFASRRGTSGADTRTGSEWLPKCRSRTEGATLTIFASFATMPAMKPCVWAPAGTPRKIIDLLYREIARAVASPDLKEKMVAIGYEPAAVPPDEFKARIKADMPKWAKVIHDAGIRP
jgi:hypothetical protein